MHAHPQNLYILSEEQFAAIMQAAVSCFALLACLLPFFAVVFSLTACARIHLVWTLYACSLCDHTRILPSMLRRAQDSLGMEEALEKQPVRASGHTDTCPPIRLLRHMLTRKRHFTCTLLAAMAAMAAWEGRLTRSTLLIRLSLFHLRHTLSPFKPHSALETRPICGRFHQPLSGRIVGPWHSRSLLFLISRGWTRVKSWMRIRPPLRESMRCRGRWTSACVQ